MSDEVMEYEDYSPLKDLIVEIEGKQVTFSLCFWLYLKSSPTLPATIIQQVRPDVTGNSPFLILNDQKKVTILPLFSLHKESYDVSCPNITSEVPHIAEEYQFPFEKWVHFGVEVSTNSVRLHIDRKVLLEKPLSSAFDKDSTLNGSSKITLLGIGGDDDNIQGYIHNLDVLPLSLSIKAHYSKDPPVQLTIDNSSTSEIEEGNDGVWSIVGGKASCRRNFSLDVVFANASGQSVSKEIEVVALLIYADNDAPVERTTDGEAPLLASFDGIEFDSDDRPSKVLHGRASFKLKISQLSSKCDNRLFRIRFYIPKMKKYPFLEAVSPPIRCISRNRNNRVPIIPKRSNSIGHVNISQSGLDEDTLEVLHNSLQETKSIPSLKHLRLGQDRTSATLRVNQTFESPDEECNSQTQTTNGAEEAYMTSSLGKPEKLQKEDNSQSDSESVDAKTSALKSISSSGNPVSDTIIFKYCLAGLTERSLMLKEIASSTINEELLNFSHQVSKYSGCSHHRKQIIMAKTLIEDGTKTWNLISQKNDHVRWEDIVFDIKEKFKKISCCSFRSLTEQDLELLRRISGCQAYMAKENFERMWCWLYPVAFTISRDGINEMWSSTSPRWIEGFITKEEAESSLKGPRGLEEPGTFILRFPTSRSWPHPDAGSLVVTYVGCDFAIHHKLLSPDHIYSSGKREKDLKPLQDMLLAEPELSRLARIVRSD